MQQKRIENFDLIRALCTLIIVFYHIACMPDTNSFWSPIPYRYANGDWGHITIVAAFFMLSGATLVLNHPTLEKKDLKIFYFKRFKSIFPMFYLVWGYMYLTNALTANTFLFRAPAKYLLLSFLGVDGYFNYLRENYYQVGEWFLGAIIMLYVVFPILLFFYNRFFIPFSVLLTALFLANLHFDWFKISDSDNFITCVFCFWLGMIFVKYRTFLCNKIYFIILALIVDAILLFIPIPINGNISMIALGGIVFYLLFHAADFVFKISFLKSFVNLTNKISYPIYLVHHVIIYYIFGKFGGSLLSHKQELLLSIPTVLSIYGIAYVVYMIHREFTHSKTWLAIEHKVLG